MLKDCRKMAADGMIDYKCENLARESQQADVDNCTNCSCLNSPPKIFCIKKRYSPLCWSPNNLFNASRYCSYIYRTYQHDWKLGKTTEILFFETRRPAAGVLSQHFGFTISTSLQSNLEKESKCAYLIYT